jgi:hypothetical protein
MKIGFNFKARGFLTHDEVSDVSAVAGGYILNRTLNADQLSLLMEWLDWRTEDGSNILTSADDDIGFCLSYQQLFMTRAFDMEGQGGEFLRALDGNLRTSDNLPHECNGNPYRELWLERQIQPNFVKAYWPNDLKTQRSACEVPSVNSLSERLGRSPFRVSLLFATRRTRRHSGSL